MSSRIIVFGYGEPALAALDTFAEMSIAPLAVVIPGNRQGDSVDAVAADARRRGHRVLTQPQRSQMAPFVDDITRLRPDFLFVWSYSMLLPPSLLQAAVHGGVNLHAGMLPSYRGGHVLNWALINGERETAATLHMIDDGIDTGPVFAERRVRIEDADDVATVHRKLTAAGRSLLREWWPKIASGDAVAVPQDETRARYYPMRTADDGRVDWSQSSARIHNLVRALAAPWPGAFTNVNGHRIVWRRLHPADAHRDAKPGTVVQLDEDAVTIAAGQGAVTIDAIEIDGVPAPIRDLTTLGIATGTVL